MRVYPATEVLNRVYGLCEYATKILFGNVDWPQNSRRFVIGQMSLHMTTNEEFRFSTTIPMECSRARREKN